MENWIKAAEKLEASRPPALQHATQPTVEVPSLLEKFMQRKGPAAMRLLKATGQAIVLAEKRKYSCVPATEAGNRFLFTPDGFVSTYKEGRTPGGFGFMGSSVLDIKEAERQAQYFFKISERTVTRRIHKALNELAAKTLH